MSALHQFTCVAIKGRAVLIDGAPGSGKSSLALALIDRGATLVGDDGVSLSALNGRIFASPAPKTAGLIEVRNVGLITLPCAEGIPVSLLLRLDPEAPRFVDEAQVAELLGITMPSLRLWPESPVLHLRAEFALARFGLP